MLGGEKTFNDRLCWALVLPLSALACVAGSVAVMAVELAVDADPGHVALRCIRAVVACYAAARMAAKVAPDRKTATAGVLATLGAAALAAQAGFSEAAAGLLGGALAVWVTWRAPDKEAADESTV